jgi:hypothetical protein
MGPGTLRPIFERAEIMLCTNHSSSGVGGESPCICP